MLNVPLFRTVRLYYGVFCSRGGFCHAAIAIFSGGGYVWGFCLGFADAVQWGFPGLTIGNQFKGSSACLPRGVTLAFS